MIWGILYLLLLVTVAAIVLRIGERESSFAIMTAIVATALTVLSLVVSGSRYDIFSMLVVSVDLAVLAVFLGHALVSRRYWTLCLPAFQLINCLTHIVKLAAPEILPRVYSAGQGFWAYPTLVIILLAALWARANGEGRGSRREQDQQEDEGASQA